MGQVGYGLTLTDIRLAIQPNYYQPTFNPSVFKPWPISTRPFATSECQIYCTNKTLGNAYTPEREQLHKHKHIAHIYNTQCRY